jgi:hypothetical protein
MKGFKHYVSLAAGVGILLLTLALANADWVLVQAANISQVFVTNTASNPVPTAAQGTTTVGGTVNAAQAGTWNVGLTGTPGVNAAQAGTWNVAINSMPDVNVANSPDVGAIQRGNWTVDLGAPVSLDRGVEGVPLFVRDADRPDRQPFHANGAIFFGNNQGGEVFFSVPFGKVLVIEHVSVEADLPIGQQAFVYVDVFDPGGLRVGRHSMALTNLGTFASFGGNSTTLVASQPIRMYAPHGNNNNPTVRIAIIRSGPGNASFGAGISGYLVDEP